MKTSKILMLSALAVVLVCITVFIVFLKYNFEHDCIKGNGNIVNKAYSFQHFKGISIDIPVHVEITQDTVQKIEASSDENILESIDIVVENEMLNIRQKNCIRGTKHIKMKISMDTLVKVDINSGSKLISNGRFNGNTLDAHISSGGELDMEIAYTQINCSLSSGAQARFAGKADYIDAELNSGSKLKAAGLETLNGRVNAGSGAIAQVNVSGELNAEANSGGNIHYVGNPAKLNVNTNSGGSVTKKEE
jgi:hypothetical protein